MPKSRAIVIPIMPKRCFGIDATNDFIEISDYTSLETLIRYLETIRDNLPAGPGVLEADALCWLSGEGAIYVSRRFWEALPAPSRAGWHAHPASAEEEAPLRLATDPIATWHLRSA